jgi:hypothetical protein
MFLSFDKVNGRLGLSSHPLSFEQEMEERFVIISISGEESRYKEPILISTFNGMILHCKEGI